MKSFKYFAMTAATLAAMAACKQAPQESGEDTAYIGPSDITVTDGHMTPEVLLSLGRLSDPQLSPDGKWILYGVSYTDIAANRSCRNLFVQEVLPGGAGDKIQLTQDGKSISNARWSPDGSAVYFLQGGQLWKAPFDGGSLGARECLSEVEAGIDEFALSPDGSQLLYVSQVHSAVEVPSDTDPALDKAQAYATEDLMYRHWDHWVETINHSFIAPLSEKVTAESSTDLLGPGEEFYELPNGPFGGIEQLAWSPDSRYIAYSCKKKVGTAYAFSTNTQIFVYDVQTGHTSSGAAVCPNGYNTNPVWSPDGESLIWLAMMRDGYEADQVHIMKALVMPDHDCEGNGQPELILHSPMCLTADFPFNADSPVFSPDGRILYFSALYDKGVQGIFRMTPDGEGLECITPEDAWYDFHSPFGFSEDGMLLTSYASMEFPTELVAVAAPSRPGSRMEGLMIRLSHENDRILDQLAPHTTEARMVRTVDGKDMLTWVLYPPQFDPQKTYPVIEICLGGPQGTLSQEWSYRWNYLLMCHQGYVVVLPNRRGTTAFGQEWCEEISGDYIGLNMQDYLSAAKVIKAEPWAGKIAACGASYGGYSVYYLAGIHKDVYDCFIAHAGIFNEEHMYMTTEEMWFPNWDNGGIPMEYAYQEGQVGPAGDGVTFGGIQQAGSPWSNKKEAVRHYANSPHKLVQNWHTPILCIHGGSDFRVPVDEGMAAFNAARMMGVPAKLIVFPNENHWILQPQNALYWHRSYFGWLDRWCKE